jgi:hypothetical protein
MGELHELVAVEKDIKTTATKIIEETNVTFSKKHQLFNTHSKSYEPLKDGDDDHPDEEKAQPITTIGEKLSYFEKQIAKMFDVILQKESANANAFANIIVKTEEDEEIILAEKVPVSALVQLENHFELIRSKVYDVIPTLDPTKNWEKDDAAGIGKYKTPPTSKQRTNKIAKPLVLHPGTEKHAPQVQLVNEDVPVGNWITVYFSGTISPAEKSIMLSRLDLVLGAIKKARSRANKTEVKSLYIGKRLFKFINEGK